MPLHIITPRHFSEHRHYPRQSWLNEERLPPRPDGIANDDEDGLIMRDHVGCSLLRVVVASIVGDQAVREQSWQVRPRTPGQACCWSAVNPSVRWRLEAPCHGNSLPDKPGGTGSPLGLAPAVSGCKGNARLGQH